MTSDVPDSYLDPYRQAAAAHGAGFHATLWQSREAQLRRFDVLIDMAAFENAVIVDAGCGPGDFVERLIERGVGYRRFIGIDGIPEQVERARQRRFERAEFIVGDFVGDPSVLADHHADYICFSGSLNTMDDATVRRLLSEAFEASNRGVLYNFLSDRALPRHLNADLHPARRFDTLAMIDWSLRQSPRVRFRQDYLDGHDATILIEHLPE